MNKQTQQMNEQINKQMNKQTNKQTNKQNERFVGKFSQIFHSASDAPHALMHGGRTNC